MSWNLIKNAAHQRQELQMETSATTGEPFPPLCLRTPHHRLPSVLPFISKQPYRYLKTKSPGSAQREGVSVWGLVRFG